MHRPTAGAGQPRWPGTRGCKVTRARSLSLVALAELDALNADYERAIEKADAALPSLLTPIDRKNIECVKGLAAGMSERAQEACSIIGNVRTELMARDLNLACLLIDDAYGVTQFANGEMARGVRWFEDSMRRRERWGTNVNRHGLSSPNRRRTMTPALTP